MSHQSFREESRKNWGKDSTNGFPSDEQLKLGAILRISDATEKMAQRHTELIAERDRFEQSRNRFASRCAMLERQLAAQKGIVTKLKKRLAIAQTQAFGGDPASVAFKSKEQSNG